METNFRVFDFNGGYGNTNASFWHKSLGGFHAAKLRNIDNLINFHLAKMNEPVYDMMNECEILLTANSIDRGATATGSPYNACSES